MPPYLSDIPIRDRSQIGLARRHAQRIAASISLSEDATHRLTLVTVEAATNILRHARKGSLLLNPTPPNAPTGVLVVASDQGPGIENLDEALADGTSSAGGMGGGLGAIQRMSCWFDIYNRPGVGTVLSAIVADGPPGDLPECCGVLAPKPEYSACGDGWAVARQGGEIWAMLCDGLGHGDKAARSADVATEVFLEAAGSSLEAVMRALNKALASERGAAVLMTRIKEEDGAAEALGIGNVTGAIVSGAGRANRLVSSGGVVGGGLPNLNPIQYDWGPNSRLIKATDGLRTIHDFTKWPGLFERGALTIAGVIHSEMTRRSDDAGVLVVKGRAA